MKTTRTTRPKSRSNPLGAISYAAELLDENEDLGDSERRMVEIINQHTLRINHIIEDILKISRGSPTARESIDLRAWLPGFLDDFCQSGLAEPEHFELSIEIDQPTVHFDTGHLAQILTNLLSNACVHADPDKTVHIRVYSGTWHPVCIEIADQGPGIDPETLDKIFEPFYTTSHQGSGLGLYIVGQLCDLNDATIIARANRYEGTSFILQLAADNRTPGASEQ